MFSCSHMYDYVFNRFKSSDTQYCKSHSKWPGNFSVILNASELLENHEVLFPLCYIQCWGIISHAVVCNSLRKG